MERRSIKTIAVASLLTLAAGVPAVADERPPKDAQPLSAIVASLEKQGYGPFVEIDLDDGRWEIEVYRGERKRKLHVDPVSGRILSDRDDD